MDCLHGQMHVMFFQKRGVVFNHQFHPLDVSVFCLVFHTVKERKQLRPPGGRIISPGPWKLSWIPGSFLPWAVLRLGVWTAFVPILLCSNCTLGYCWADSCHPLIRIRSGELVLILPHPVRDHAEPCSVILLQSKLSKLDRIWASSWL